MKYHHFKSLKELKEHILTKVPTLYVGSKTSTVLPYENFLNKPLDYGLKLTQVIGDLSSLPKKLELDSEGNLLIEGAVTWQDAKSYCEANGRQIMTSPTEELALCLSGIATSATGERSFAYGSVKNQVNSISYLNYKAELKTLSSFKQFQFEDREFASYQKSYEYYQKFKNAPFPRLEKETDLMCGMEGQLGVIVRAIFKTVAKGREMYLFCKLPKWEVNFEAHLEFFNAIQAFRGKISACEFIDENSIAYLPQEDRPAELCDLIFIEMNEEYFTEIYEGFVLKLKHLNEENFFQMNGSKCREFRMQIPRHIFEANQKMGVTKVGTDVQVDGEHFSDLLNIYKSFKKYNISYNLFGHFGDAHLHFNFMPTKEQLSHCQKILEDFYLEVKKLKGSPFAEHGIGTLKRKYIKNFYQDVHLNIFKELKKTYDPDGIFFPDGFLNYAGSKMSTDAVISLPEWQREADDFLKIASDFKLGRLPTESPHPDSKNLSDLTKNNLKDAFAVLKKIDLNFFEILESKIDQLIRLKIDIKETIESGGRIFICGCGATGRLSLALERIWRQDMNNSDLVISFMAGGDLALISSIEKFEDYPEYGARQLKDLGFKSNDLLISSSEGGETPWVIGAVNEARNISSRSPYFLYCNPDKVLIETVKRSKNIIEDTHVKKINLFCGEMALAGSTRMQASSILMFGIGLALLNYKIEHNSLKKELMSLKNFYQNFAIESFENFTVNEASTYQRGEYCHYLTDSHLGISVLTDTTERSPTFSLKPFENYQEASTSPGLSYLSYPHIKECKEAWKFLLGRMPRALKWSEVEKIAGESRLYGYEVGSEGLLKREKNLKSKKNNYFQVFLINHTLSFNFQNQGLDVDVRELSTLSRHLFLKMLLNIHSTSLMGVLGRYESNIMTYVRASNNKLIDRTARNVAYLLGDKAQGISYEKIVYSIFKLRKELSSDEPLVLKVLSDLS